MVRRRSIYSFIALALVVGGLLHTIPAEACSPMPGLAARSPARKLSDASAEVKRAFAIIDAEVVRAGGYDSGPALLYAHRIFKGPQGPWFEVGTNDRDSCAREFPQVGERMRLFLFSGQNGLFAADLFVGDRYVDRLLKSDRRRQFPYFAGPRP